MKKKLAIGAGIFTTLLISVAAFGFYYMKPEKEKVLEFMVKNPGKSAILLIHNDSIMAASNINQLMPLASTVKIIVAIEYAEQARAGLILPDEMIGLTELEKFHVPNTDGGAHAAWLKAAQDKIVDGKVSIREIAKGMISFSSNANTEWLQARLGLENVNSRLDSLGIEQHSKLYYLVSSLFVGKEAFPGVKGKELEKKLVQLSMEDYISSTNAIHLKLLSDATYKNDFGDLGMPIQKIWSDRLPASTVKEYVGLMQKINSRQFFHPQTQVYLDEVMEFLLENPANREWLQHAGMKGGSTAFVLTKAMYTTDKKGNKTELVYFLNNLSLIEVTKLQMSMNEFELNILVDESFRKQVMNAFR